jgi:signal transduction histidine kinase
VTALREAHAKLESYARDLEAKVRERTAKLEETVAELESFSYSLSHDMRAPIRAIQSFTELVLRDHGPKLGEGADLLDRVISSAGRMDRLIQDVLSFAKISRSEITLSNVNISGLLAAIIEERPELSDPAVKITIEQPLLLVKGHDMLLTQCLTNLMDNAVKFVRPNLPPQVRVFTEKIGDVVRIAVQDNGIGIELEEQNRLFSLFQRMPNASTFRGTGVGLAIVRRAAQRMNGKVGVQSLAGQGSTFWIELSEAP